MICNCILEFVHIAVIWSILRLLGTHLFPENWYFDRWKEKEEITWKQMKIKKINLSKQEQKNASQEELSFSSYLTLITFWNSQFPSAQYV